MRVSAINRRTLIATASAAGASAMLPLTASTKPVQTVYFSDRITGPAEISSDGTVTKGRRLVAAPTGMSAPKGLKVDLRGPSGQRHVWLSGPTTPAFRISRTSDTGDNSDPRIVDDVLYWQNSLSGLRVERLYYAAPTLARGVEKLVLIIASGQSTAVGSANKAVVTHNPPRPGYVLMWNAGIRVLGHDHGPSRRDERLPPENALYLVDAHEQLAAATGETQWTQAAYECQKRLGDKVAVVAAAIAIGSQSYETITRRTLPYDNLIEITERTRTLAALKGLAFDVVVCWPEHEANVRDSQAAFLAKTVEFQKFLTLDIGRIDESVGDVRLVVDGFSGDTRYKTDISEQPLAQLQWAVENPLKGGYSAPTYLFASVDRDGVHRTAEGAALDGAYFGRTVANLLLGKDSAPLYVKDFRVSADDTIDCTVHLPDGAVALSATSPIVTELENYGISCHRQDNDAAITVKSVTITGKASYRVVLSSPPRNVPLWLEIGFRGHIEAPSGPSRGDRSTLNDGNSERSAFGVQMANHHAPQRLSVTFKAAP